MSIFRAIAFTRRSAVVFTNSLSFIVKSPDLRVIRKQTNDASPRALRRLLLKHRQNFGETNFQRCDATFMVGRFHCAS